MEDKPRNWGGARREAPPSSPRTYNMRDEVLENLKEIPNKSEFVSDAVREKLEREKTA